MRLSIPCLAALIVLACIQLTPTAEALSRPIISGTFVPTTEDGAVASSDIDPTCLLCEVSNVENLVAPRINSAAVMSLPLGVAGSARIKVQLANALSGPAAVGFVVTERVGLVNLSVFEAITIRAYMGDEVVSERQGSSVLRTEIGSTGRYSFMMRTDGSAFDALEIEIGGLAIAATSFEVKYAAIRQRVAPDVVLADASLGDTISSSSSSLCLGCSLQEPQNAIDGRSREFAVLDIPLGVLASAEATISWRQTIPAGARGGAVLSTPTGILDAEVLSRLTVRLLRGGEVVASASSGGLAAINYRNGRTFVQVRSNQAFDDVQVEVTGAALLSTEVRIHSVAAVVRGGLADARMIQDVEDAMLETTPSAPLASSDQAEALAFEALHPNPATDRARVTLVLERAGPVRVTLHDLLGRQVGVVEDAHLGAGHRTLDIDTSRLATGVYLIVGETESGRATHRLTVAR